MRVFIGLVEVAGRNAALKRGLEQLGHPTTFVNLSPHRFQYGSDDPLFLVRVIRRLAVLRRQLPRGILRPALVVPEFLSRLALLLQILATHDVFIFSSASSFFRYWDYRVMSFLAYWDYRLIRFFGKKLICQFHGSDSRPHYLNGAYACQPDFSIAKCARDTDAQKKRLRIIDEWADAIIDMPPQGYFHQRPYYTMLRLGLPSGPFDAPRPNPELKSAAGVSARPVRILHAPSNARYKGTAQIREMVQRLMARGLAIEFIEVQEKSNDEVVAEIQKADLVVDQLYCDFGLSALTAEALWWGKAVISGGYSADLWAKLLPAGLLPPAVHCHPADFAIRLEQLVMDGNLRLKLGAAGYDYIRRFHHPKIVADNYLKVAGGEAPAEWLYDPRQMKEVWGGFFMSEDRAQEITREVVREFGRKSLQLSDKPALEEAIVNWAHSVAVRAIEVHKKQIGSD
jgi:hypothetical protein